MLKGWSVYGPENGNRVDLVMYGDGSCELSVRIDARADADAFLRRWIILMMELNCTQYAPELDRSFPAEMVSLKDALQSWTAWQFALAAL